MKLIYSFAFLFLLSSCQHNMLLVQTEYINEQFLASTHVNTPDPRINCPPIGQRLIITWSIPRRVKCFDNVHLQIAYRTYNQQEESKIIPIRKRSGTYTLSFINEEYTSTCGIQTYKVDLIADDCILEEWQHQLWVRKITIRDDTPLD